MEKKGAIGLSINVLVVVIISIVILVAGLKLLQGFIKQSTDLKDNLDQQTEAQLRNHLIDQGKKVALSKNFIAIPSGEDLLIGIGISNFYEDSTSFTISFTPSRYINPQGEVANFPDNPPLFNYINDYLIPAKKHDTGPILITVPKETPKGDYIFNVDVSSPENQPYDNTKKLTIKVN